MSSGQNRVGTGATVKTDNDFFQNDGKRIRCENMQHP